MMTQEATLHITHLTPIALRSLYPSFERLPHTTHADGQYRLRRYSVVTFLNQTITPLADHHFVQSSEINSFQGDVIREFEPLEVETFRSEGLIELCTIFCQTNGLPDGQKIEIHQMRVAAVFDETPVAPEGVHQDGVDHIALVSINRSNIVGGDVMLYENPNHAPFFRKVLGNGDVVLVADKLLWHNAQPIKIIDPDQLGYMDVIVLTAKEGDYASKS